MTGREFDNNRCAICGNFMIFDPETGEVKCPDCNCTVSEVDHFLPYECR